MAAQRPIGSAWEAPQAISGTGGVAEGPLALAVDEAGDAVAAWTERSGGSEAVEVSVRPAGGSWSTPKTFATGGEAAKAPAVAVDPDGDVVLGWVQEAGGVRTIEGSSLPAGTLSWTAPTPLSGNLEEAEAISITISASGTATAVWHSTDGVMTWISGASLQIGGTWTLEGEVSEPAPATESPQVEVDGAGEFFAIWSRAGVGRVTEVARRAPGGTWGHAVPISSNGPLAEHPRIAVGPAGNAVAVWLSVEGAEESIEAARLGAGETSWGSPHQLAPPDGEVEAPSVALGPGGVAEVTWSGWNEATHNYESHAAHLGPRGLWKAAVAISRLREEALSPQVRISRSGHVIVVWVSFEVTIVIKSTEGEETAPLAVTKVGDGAGTVTSEPAGIDCGASCAARFVEGAEVALKAEPAAGSRFVGWSGACSGAGSCSLEIGEAQAVRAEFVAVGEETGGGTGGGGDSGGSSTTATGDVATSKATGGGVLLAPAPKGLICTPITAARVSGFVPKAKPGKVVPGVRAKVSVRRPSTVKVSAILGFGKGSSIRLADLGSVAFHTAGSRNLRFGLPKGLRSALPLGSGARLILSIAARPDAGQGCGQPSTVKRQLAVKVVKVLSGRQAGVN